MTEPTDPPEPIATPQPPLRWYQFRLRTLLAFMTVVVGLLVACRQWGEPYRRQRETMALIKELGGGFQAAEASAWQHLFFGADLQNVTAVYLWDRDEPDRYISYVADLPCLEVLAVGGLDFTDRHLRLLRDCTMLRVLVLDSTAVTSEQLAVWQKEHPRVCAYRSPQRAVEKTLALGFIVTHGGDYEGPAEIRTLFGSMFFDRVVALGALHDFYTIGDESLVHLPCLPDLERIDLSDTNVGDAGLIHLRGLERLETLDLSRTKISDAGLPDVGGFRALVKLYLSGTSIHDSGAAHLASLTNLVRLDLDGTSVSDAGLKHLRALPNLAVLYLDSTKITDAGLSELRNFPALRAVFLRQNGISARAKSQLQVALPECFICID